MSKSQDQADREQQFQVGIYCRISLDKTGDELGVQRQLDEARRIAKHRGWNVQKEYVDNSKSAFQRSVKRPQYDQMVTDAKAGLINGVIVWDLDRLTRQPRQIEDWCDMGEQKAFVLVTVDGAHDLSTGNGRMFARIKASVARQESEHKAKRQRFSNEQRAKMGKPPHTGRAYGYNIDGTVREEEAEQVRRSFNQFLSGSALSTIASWLNDRGATNVRGGQWDRTDVRMMLINPRYVAERWLFRTLPEGGRVQEYVGPGDWEPLISDDLFKSAAAAIRDPSRLAKFGRNGNARKYFGSGLFRCAVCRERMKAAYSGGGGKSPHYRTYRCPKWHVVRKAEYVEDIVNGAVQARLRDPKVISGLAAEQGAESQVARLRDEANILRSRLDQITGDYAEGIITGRQLKIATEATEQKLSAAEAKLVAVGMPKPISELLRSVDPGEVWQNITDVGVKMQILEALGTVYLDSVPNGARRPSEKNVEKFERWVEGQRSTVHIDWRGVKDSEG